MPETRMAAGLSNARHHQGAVMNSVIAERIAQRLRREGWDCTADDVIFVHEHGTHDSASLASAIIAELEELGLL